MVETDDVEQQQQQQQHQYGYDTGVAVGGGEQFYLAYSYFDEDEMVVRPLQFLDAHLAATFAPNDFYEDEYNNNNGWDEDGSSTGVNEQSAGQNGDEPGWFKQAREADAASVAATRQSVIKRTWDYALPADMPIEVTCKQCQQSAGMYPARHVCYQPNDETPILHSQNEDRTTDVVAVTDRGVAGAQPQLVFRPSISSPEQPTQDEQSTLPQIDEQLSQQHYQLQQHHYQLHQQQHYVETTPDAANVSSNNGWDDLAESVMEQPASATTAQTPTGELAAKPSKNKKNRYAMHGNTTYAVQDSSKRKSMMPQSAKANKRITILDTSRPIDGKLVPLPSKLQRKVTDNNEETKQKSGSKKKKPQIWDAFVDKIVPQSMKKSNNRVSLAVQQYYKEQGEELPDWYNDLVNAEEEELKSKPQAQQDSTAATTAAPIRPPREVRTPASAVQQQPAPLHQLQQQLHHQQQQQQW
ncbi:hypothetical protein GQ42DRAFT_163795 [Ramicandelaber brevisporus]|nr:hypothetical protein GQ42DRAFT_163795 [Ramicandelaber brevisporus]